MELPKLSNPTEEEVTKYHALYIAQLTDLFDKHEARFAAPGAQLEIW